MKMSAVKYWLWTATIAAFLPVLLLAAILPSGRRHLLVWGSVPLISNISWSAAMVQAGYASRTIMQGHYPISKPDDFDHYFKDFVPSYLPHLTRMGLGSILALLFVLRRASVVHIPFEGFALNASALWRVEGALLSLARVKVVVLPYGADAYLYSKVIDTSLRYGLLASYPQLARKEAAIAARLEYWSRRADAVVAGLMVDGMGRWDVTTNCPFCIDVEQWRPGGSYSAADGTDSEVLVIHTPNHRGFKGTEFLVRAIEELQAEGLKVRLVLIEQMPNECVREAMQRADILAEQFIGIGYAFSGIEGMASGLPVLANLDHDAYTRVFRRYGFLDECPILSSPPERLKDNLRILITNPALREELGRAGRAYVEKYHSYKTAEYLFGSIYARILDGKDVDLINLFHPLKSHYVRATPRIGHPLVENRLPADWAPQ